MKKSGQSDKQIHKTSVRLTKEGENAWHFLRGRDGDFSLSRAVDVWLQRRASSDRDLNLTACSEESECLRFRSLEEAAGGLATVLESILTEHNIHNDKRAEAGEALEALRTFESRW